MLISFGYVIYKSNISILYLSKMFQWWKQSKSSIFIFPLSTFTVASGESLKATGCKTNPEPGAVKTQLNTVLSSLYGQSIAEVVFSSFKWSRLYVYNMYVWILFLICLWVLWWLNFECPLNSVTHTDCFSDLICMITSDYICTITSVGP